ncbi:DUF4335 domain-containing protein [Rivularia sp. UHCC 0363]|uniref:DUF4335 domain-containing protein n=1 Tax=Rivularia sp. UHCC 0363 TaxID=3110244 RepID=UPI002B2091DE|nr:DUF4335 domain-containing protein [Rivularia sp. UHCC 0363]MEA5595802.1 DUF4335 domain-containing protein [Rivularia sp. UHCC 0363]
MPLSNSVIRRYTPPTCTLEVLAQSSPLSRWMGKSVLKQVRFNLSFDDPRQPEAEKIVVQGDRDQLEALYTAVSNYVQDILQQSPESFWASRVEAHSARKTSETTVVEDVNNSQPDISNFRNEFASRGNIYLKPSSHLTHQLFLGSLASQVRGSSIQLSLLQLFDLATALDEYVADVVAMPTVTQRRRNSFAIPAWAPVAAVLVLGLGLMPITYQYANRLREQRKTGETVATANKEIGSDVSPTPLLTPLPTPNSLLTPLPNASPLPTLGSGLSVPNVPSSLASPNPTLGTTPGSTFPSVSNPNSSSTIPLPPSGSSSLGGSTTIKPGTGGSTLSLTPNSSSGKTQGTNSSTSSKGKTSLPSQIPSTSLPPLINPTSPVIPILPPSKQASAPQNNNQGALTNPTKLDRDLAAQLRESRTATPANNDRKSTTTAANSETLFDTNQVAEVRSYLKQRWQPPNGLKEPLQYSLTVGVDGALEQILPLGKAARDYVEKAGIPEIGQPFVSPSRNGQNVRVRAVFKPNGQVQAFPETD